MKHERNRRWISSNIGSVPIPRAQGETILAKVTGRAAVVAPSPR